MATKVPTLSTLGWVDTIEEKGDYALSYFITSEYSQSVLYYGQISSLQWLVKQYSKDEITLENEIRVVLEGLMRRYFGDQTEVEVTVRETNPEENPGHLTILFSCIVREGTRSVSLGRRVEFINGKLVKIAKINNG